MLKKQPVYLCSYIHVVMYTVCTVLTGLYLRQGPRNQDCRGPGGTHAPYPSFVETIANPSRSKGLELLLAPLPRFFKPSYVPASEAMKRKPFSCFNLLLFPSSLAKENWLARTHCADVPLL